MSDPANEHQIFKAARKRASLAQAWRFNQQDEDALAAIARNPAIESTLSADHRSMLYYYESARSAAKAEGLDISGGNQR